MTLTNPVINGSVWIAPAGTAPDDAGAWTHIGYTNKVVLEEDDDSDGALLAEARRVARLPCPVPFSRPHGSAARSDHVTCAPVALLGPRR